MRRKSSKRFLWSTSSVCDLAIVSVIVGFAYSGIPAARAEETASSARAAAPEISIKSYFREMKKHSKSEPLLIQTTLANTDANNVLMQNQRSDKEHAHPVPVVALGSSTAPINQLLSVTIVPKNDAKRETKIVVLAVSKKLPSRLNLDGTRSLKVYLGLDKDALSLLSSGFYTVRATLDSSSQQGMWQGRVSEEFDLELIEGEAGSSADEQAALVYGYGKFYLLDHQFEKVEPYAKWLEKRDANSVGAAELRGDAALASGHYEQAVDSFHDAIRRAKAGQSADSEPPVYLHNRWEQAMTLLGKTKRQ